VQQKLQAGFAPSGIALVHRKSLISLAGSTCFLMQHGKPRRLESGTWRACLQVLHKVTHRPGGKLRFDFEIMDLGHILEAIAKNRAQLTHG
jgi:hypothetical protein